MAISQFDSKRTVCVVSLLTLSGLTSATLAQVQEEWVVRFDAATFDDDPGAMAIDASGNIFVTGSSDLTGCQQPECRDIPIVKYDSDGTQLWVKFYDRGGQDRGTRLAVDGDGYVYVAGLSTGEAGIDIVTLKYDPDNELLWDRFYPGWYDTRAITVDDGGNVYVAGGVEGQNGLSAYVVLKYDSEGTLLWDRVRDERPDSDIVYDIGIDSTDNVIVTGRSFDSNTSWDFLTIKYDPQGNLLWLHRYDGPGHRVDDAVAVAVDGADNIYVAGRSFHLDTGSDFLILKYDPDGNVLWEGRYDSGSAQQYVSDMALDNEENVVVTGHDLRDYHTVKFTAGGELLWARSYDGSNGRSDAATALAVDEHDNVYVTGQLNYNGSADCGTIRYDPDGTLRWAMPYDGPDSGYDVPTGIASNQLGNVYVLGNSEGACGIHCSDFATINYAQSMCTADLDSSGDVGFGDLLAVLAAWGPCE